MAVNSKEAKKRLYQEALKELKGLLSSAGLLPDGDGARLDRVGVLRQALDVLRSHPSLSNAGPLDLSPAGRRELPLPPLHPALPAPDPPHLTLTLALAALPHYTITTVDAPPPSPLQELAKELPPKLNLISALVAADGIVFSSAMLRLSTGSPPLSLAIRLWGVPVTATASAAPDRASATLLCHLVASPFAGLADGAEVAFETRHGPDLRLSGLDRVGMAVLGRLPQDVLGTSLLALLHRDDAAALRHAHQQGTSHYLSQRLTFQPLAVARGLGRSVAGRCSVRFLLPSGGVLGVESEWAGLANPWTGLLDTIVGRHRVRAPGPGGTPFAPLDLPHPAAFPEAASAALQADISAILSKVCPLRLPSCPSSDEVCLFCCQAVRSERQGDSPLEASTSPLREALLDPPGSSSARKARKAGRDFSVFLDDVIQRVYKAPEEVAAGEAGVSPPDSAGSGPLSYGFLNTIEKVQRLLESHRPGSPPLHSPPPRPPVAPPSPSSSVQAEPLRLTKKTLDEHTRKLELEHKETWKRKFSGDLAQAQPTTPINNNNNYHNPNHAAHSRTPDPPLRSLKRALESPPEPGELPIKHHRQASAEPPKPTPCSSHHTTEYYRPNPPPPPGRNVQITSLPLASGHPMPAPTPATFASAALELQALSQQRQAANEAAARAFLVRPAPQPWPAALLPRPPPPQAPLYWPGPSTSHQEAHAWLPPPTNPPHQPPLHSPPRVGCPFMVPRNDQSQTVRLTRSVGK